MVLQLQRAAGNLAVTRALQRARSAAAGAGATAVQLESTGSSAEGQPGPQLGVLWNAQVVVPLARAQDRVGRSTRDYPGAKTDLVGALATITTLRDATPSSDRNRLRFEIVERQARGVLEIVNQRLGIGRTNSQLDGDTIKIRIEAAQLGPKLQHRPGPEAAKYIGGGADEHAASNGEAMDTTSGQAPSPAPAPVAPESAPTAGAAPTPAGPGADGSSEDEGTSIQELWDFLVVRRLWAAQKQLSEDPKFAIMDYNNARLYALLFLQATPEGHPNRLPLMALEAGIEAIAGQMASRATGFETGDPLDDQAVNVWETATAMVEFLPGAQQPAAAEQPTPGKQEPDFTWESAPPGRSNDTDLERPDGSRG